MILDYVSEIASFLLKCNALQFGSFKLSSGKESSYYIDLRVVQSFPKHFRLTIHQLRQTIIKEIGCDFDSLGSVPTSGLVFAAALAYEMLKPLIYVRKESKAHGSSKMIEGYINPGAKVLLIDDVATTGVSVSNAVHTIRANGGIVENVVTILDRLEGAEDKLKKINVKLTPITTINDIIDTLYEKGLISNNNLKSVMHQINRDLDEY